MPTRTDKSRDTATRHVIPGQEMIELMVESNATDLVVTHSDSVVIMGAREKYFGVQQNSVTFLLHIIIADSFYSKAHVRQHATKLSNFVLRQNCASKLPV